MFKTIRMQVQKINIHNTPVHSHVKCNCFKEEITYKYKVMLFYIFTINIRMTVNLTVVSSIPTQGGEILHIFILSLW